MNVSILHEDANFLILNKPAGLMVHGDGRSKEPTLADWLAENRPELKKVGESLRLEKSGNVEEILRPGIVHRLDRDTSGAIVIAKNEQAFAHLKEQFKSRRVRKIYHAIVAGNIKEDDGVIDKPIGRSASDFRKKTTGRVAIRGEIREAVTRFHVLGRGQIGGEPVTFVEAMPKTGRTHQIRVHFKSIHHPVIGDMLYGPRSSENLSENIQKNIEIGRLALHAFSVSFTGINGREISATAPYPEDFARAVEAVPGRT